MNRVSASAAAPARGLFGARLVAAALAGLVLVVTTSAPAGAWTGRSTNTYYDPGRVWMTMGVPYGGWAHYSAVWQREYLYPSYATGGLSKWRFRKFDVTWIAELGRDCFKRTELRCQDHLMSAKVEFLSTSGAVLSSFTLNKLSGPTCYDHMTYPRDFVDYRCRPGPFEISGAATKIRFTFNFGFQRHDGFWFSWPTVKKTVRV